MREDFETASVKRQDIARLAACALCVGGAWTGAAYGQAPYPSRPIRLVVPFAPGGGSDVLARLLGPRLAERLGQPVVVDNRPAAAGVLGADIVAKSAPDGHTLLGTTVTFVISGALRTGLPYDSVKDFRRSRWLSCRRSGCCCTPRCRLKR